jgi:hypothetical protein
MNHPTAFLKPSQDFLNELSDYLRGKSVLEVFAGNGYLASELEKRGVTTTATSLFSGHDGHAHAMYSKVREMDARVAAREYRDTHDVLLMSWPVADESALRAILEWGSDKPVVYIGETPHLELPGLMGLSGCASDLFFESIRWERFFESYHGNMLEKAGILYLNTQK